MPGKRCALLIGNNAYCNAEFPPLTKPARDVKDFAALLRDPQIGAFDEVTECVDRSWHEARLDISRFFRQRDKDDLLLLYFSGHGRREPSGEFYLVFDDTEFGDLDASAINAQFVRKHIDSSLSQRKVVILDCCHSGAFFGEKGATTGAEDTVSAFEGNGSGKIILAASQALQGAQENAPEGISTPYSLFTHFLIEGLRTGKADLDDDGKIGAEELFGYVEQEMLAIKSPQTPKKFVSAHGEIVVAKNPSWKPRSDRSLLPRWLLNRLDEDDSSDRFRAVDDLISIIQRKDERCAVAALAELRRLSHEDKSPRVRRAAEGGLEELDEFEQHESPHVVEEIIELRGDEYELIEDLNEPSAGDLWREPVTGMEFVYIPAGQFMMGQTETEKAQLIKEVGKEKYQEWFTDELPRHQVTISQGFWMGKYPVTNAQYRRFKADHDSGAYEGHALNGDDQPVVMVSWDDAQAFLEWLNATVGAGSPRPSQGTSNQGAATAPLRFRLPSEAEWEYACRAGTETIRYWGDDSNHDQASLYANVADLAAKKIWPNWVVHNCDDGYAVSSPVGKFRPNAFGLYDMLGNVWEWCQDSYASYDETPKDGSAYGSLGDGKTKLLRGGSWSARPSSVRSAYRSWGVPGHLSGSVGFRVVVVR